MVGNNLDGLTHRSDGDTHLHIDTYQNNGESNKGSLSTKRDGGYLLHKE